jgi:hypothetical protein
MKSKTTFFKIMNTHYIINNILKKFVSDKIMTQYRFRLTGVPPDQAIKLIEVDPNQSIAEIKKTVQREYKLNPILAIQFIFKGKVLPDQLKFAKIGIHPKKDVITVMATQAGG